MFVAKHLDSSCVYLHFALPLEFLLHFYHRQLTLVISYVQKQFPNFLSALGWGLFLHQVWEALFQELTCSTDFGVHIPKLK